MEGIGGGRDLGRLKPLRTSIVKLKYFKKGGGTLDSSYKSFKNLTKRLYLMCLTPDALQLYTTRDAGDAGDELSRESPPTISHSLSSLVKSPMRLTTKKREGAAEDELGAQPPTGTAELEEDQVFTISVSLSQIVSVTLQDGKCLKVAFHPNKPNKNKVSEDAVTMMKAVFLPLWYPMHSLARENWDLSTFLENHVRKDPTVHTFLIEAPDTQEAASLKAAIESATSRLWQALQWLSKGLPLLDESSITLVSMDVPASAPAWGLGLGVGGTTSGASQQVVLATHPCFGDRLPLPAVVSEDIAAAGGSSSSSSGIEGGGGDGGRRPAALRVWLHTPLGPAQVDFVPSEVLRDEAAAAGCPFTLRTTPTAKDTSRRRSGVAGMLEGSESGLEVLLRCCLCQGEELPPGSDPAAAPAVPSAASSVGVQSGWLEAPSEGLRMRFLAIVAVLLIILINWVQAGNGSNWAAVDVLRSVSFLVTSLCGVGVIAALALWFNPSREDGTLQREAGASTKDAAQHPTRHRWFLELLEADLVERTAQEGSSLPLALSLSVTSAKPPPELSVTVLGKELPKSIQHLMEQHPGLVNANVAERFLIGWGTPTQAYTGLVDMVAWMRKEGLEGLVSQPQPRLHLIKRHYRHGIVGQSKGGIPVEIECVGKWKAAYEALRKEGVTEQEMLHHLVFTYEYTFTYVDSRPLPHGKTVKIVDLEGLCMGDIRCDAFKFLTKVGALLNLNYPQRLHACFLVNAPTWWAVVWRLISPMIAKKTREQMFLYGKNDQEAMRRAILEEVSPDQLPQEYGGTCKVPLYESKHERELTEHVLLLQQASAAAAGAGRQV